MPYVYILECADGSYYTGSTTDLDRCLWEHQNRQGANYTVNRLPVKLVYCDECAQIDDACYRKKQIQGWNRKKKKALIDGKTNRLHRLAEYRGEEAHCKEVKPCRGRTDSLNRVSPAAPKHFSTSPPPTASPVAIIALTTGGRKLAARLGPQLKAEVIDYQTQGLTPTLAEAWTRYDGLVLIMAAGIAVRTIAPLIKDKRNDPGVVVMDEAGRFAVSLLSGHLGGGNELARQVAAITHGQSVITTASDTLGLTAIDLWARYNHLVLVQGSLTLASAALVNNRRITVFTDLDGTLPADFTTVTRMEEAELIISNRHPPTATSLAVLCPQNLTMGIGCNRGTPMTEIEHAAVTTCLQHGIYFQAVSQLASIDIKQDEPGLLQFAAAHGLTQHWYQAKQLNSVPGITSSKAVFKATGAKAVAEPAAMLAAQTHTLLIRKIKWNNVTIALAETPVKLSAAYQSSAPDRAASNI